MTKQLSLTVGVLALQGAFVEHENHLKEAFSKLERNGELEGVTEYVIQVRTPEELAHCDALVIPGGESTSISLVAERTGLLEPLRRFVKHDQKPVWGTCAGLILLAEQATRTKKDGQELIGGLDVRVERNHFGRQTESFATKLVLPVVGDEPFECVFIRAPVVEAIIDGTDDESEADKSEDRLVSAPGHKIGTSKVTILGKLFGKHNKQGSDRKDERGQVVAVQQNNIVGTSFHPELTQDTRLHEWWLRECVLRHTLR